MVQLRAFGALPAAPRLRAIGRPRRSAGRRDACVRYLPLTSLVLPLLTSQRV